MIADRTVRDALEVVSNELEMQESRIADLENQVMNLEGDLESTQVERDNLLNDVAELNEQILDLEQALAEAYLTDTTDDGTKEGNAAD